MMEEDEWESPPITERDIRMIAATLYDGGEGHILPDMIESVTGIRPADDEYSPKKLRIRGDAEWSAYRKRRARRESKKRKRANESNEEKLARVANLEKWKVKNPEKMREAAARKLEKKKKDRQSRGFVAVDLEGFDTDRYFTDDRPDARRDYVEKLARGTTADEDSTAALLRIGEEKVVIPFNGWTVHDRQWYLDQHDLTADDPIPCAGNKRPGTPPIYIEHRPFLFGAGNDSDQYFLTENDEIEKTALSGEKILNAIVDLPKRFGDATFVSFAFGYDVSQILRCLDADTAGKLQAGEIVIKSIDEDGAPCEEIIKQSTVFWNEFAISYIRGKMFRVGRLNDPANPYKFEEIADPVRRQAYIDAGRNPVKAKIDYKDGPVTINDTFGFFQMSFIDAYEGSGISFTLEEAKIIVEGKRKRNVMSSLPMNEIKLYQEMELRILCRMMNKLKDTITALGLELPHWCGAGAISSAMSIKHRGKDFYPKINTSNYSPQQEWAHHCFAGGRIEMIMQGRHTGGVDENEYGPPPPALRI
jgi:hypothetical protein